MRTYEKARQLLLAGNDPGQIATLMGVSAATVIPYLQKSVGEGSLRLSDVYYSWSSRKRQFLHRVSGSDAVDAGRLTANDTTPEEVRLFRSLRSPRAFAGDMYDYVSEVEIAIHGLVKRVLQTKFGTRQQRWWREGVPLSVRKACVGRREEDSDPCSPPFAYTTLIELSEVIQARWSLFSETLPPAYRQKRGLKDELIRLNAIRNVVMHPVKGRRWTEEDFGFVRGLRNALVPMTVSDAVSERRTHGASLRST